MKYKIVHQLEDCIGCGACAAICPKFWSMKENGKSELKAAKSAGPNKKELEISDKDLETNKEAAESCPVNAIRITDEKGKKII